MSKTDRSFRGDFRKFFAKGLGIILPTLLTIAIFAWAYVFLRDNIANRINATARWAVITIGPPTIGPENMPRWYEVSETQIDRAMENALPRPQTREDAAHAVRVEAFKVAWDHAWYLKAFGFVVAVVLVYLAGVFMGNFLGRRLYSRFEKVFIRLPIVKQVYPSVKQVTDFVLGDNDHKKALPSNRVVLVEYPRPGIWTVGLLTGETMVAIEHIAGERCVTIFIPSSPTPFTGYTINVPAKEVYELPITMDETIRFVVSGGVLIPEAQRPETAPTVNLQEMKGNAKAGAADLAQGPQTAMMDDADGPAGPDGRSGGRESE